MGNNTVVVAGLMIGVVFGLGGAAFAGDPHAVKVSVGYADTFHADAALQYVPSPWLGSPSVTFIGAPRAVADCGYPNCYTMPRQLNSTTPPPNHSRLMG